MPALSFEKRFVSRIEDGTKQHTIRAYRKRPFCVGDDLALFTAMRTKQCRRIFNAPCVRVEDIAITVYYGWIAVVIDGQELSRDEVNALAQCDGFADMPDMARFWGSNHGLGPFHGQIIHWDYARRYMPRPKARKAAA
jgi:hypothetical protein